METTFFAVLAACALIPGFFAVRGSNLVHAALWLGASLLATAGIYATLGASFLAGVQVLVYVGGIVTLMIFGVMITRRHDGSTIQPGTVQGWRGAAAAIGLFVVLFVAISKTDLPSGDGPPAVTTRELARSLLDDNLFAFEVASLLLLAAIVGAVVLARRRDADPEAQGVSGSMNELPTRELLATSQEASKR